MKPAITVDLFVEPLPVSPAHLDDAMIGFTVKNIGSTTIDPQLNLSELRVDGGQPSHDWGMALMNSGHEVKWKALPPGESVTGRWPLARALFPRPGAYKLQLTVSEVPSRVLDVQVTP